MIRLVLVVCCLMAASAYGQGTSWSVREFGAKGDGRTNDTRAIDAAITAAAGSGGGAVVFPAGEYLSFTIHLQSNITLNLDQGAVLIGDREADGTGYDLPEDPAGCGKFQDYGHSHWKNSLIYGEGLHDIAITGHGRIWGGGCKPMTSQT